MLCSTPAIILPTAYLNATKPRQTRSIGRRATRVRRQSQSGKLNSDELEFYLGLLLDNVRKYEDLSISLSAYSTLDVYIDPVIYHFTQMPYDYSAGAVMQIKVSLLKPLFL